MKQQPTPAHYAGYSIDFGEWIDAKPRWFRVAFYAVCVTCVLWGLS